MYIVKIILETGEILLFEFFISPTKAQVISAMKGIGGRPNDRKAHSITVVMPDGEEIIFYSDVAPSKEEIILAIKGIGGRPNDRG